MDKLQQSLKVGAESSPSYHMKQPFLKRLADRARFTLRGLPFSVTQVPQADMIVDEQTAIFYKALQLAGKEPRFYDPIVDAFKGRDSTDYALTSLTLAESIATDFSYDRSLHGFDVATENVVKRLLRSVNRDAEVGRYSNPNWSGKATERLDRARDLVGRYDIDMDTATSSRNVIGGLNSEIRHESEIGRYSHRDWFDIALKKADDARTLNERHNLGADTSTGYKLIVEGLTAEVRHESEIGRYSHNDWTLRAKERADRIKLLNGVHGLGLDETLAYGMIIDGLVAEIRYETEIGKYSHRDWQDRANGKANRAMGLAVTYTPGRILGLNKSFQDLSLTLQAQSS